VFSGPGIVTGNTNDPVLYLYKGFTYTFVNTTGSNHPFAIRVSNGGAAYTSGVSGSQTGTQTFVVPMNAPSTLYYQCTLHSSMGNVINIV
jgi:plastocyanin